MKIEYFVLLFLIGYFGWSLYKRDNLKKRINEIRIENADRNILFICTGVEDLGDNLTQFYGEVIGGDIYPKAQSVNINGNKYDVKEVYANEATPNKPSAVAPDNSTNVALVISDESSVYKFVKQEIKIHKFFSIVINNN